MRLLFFILLLANVVFLAYSWFEPGALAGAEGQILGQQLDPNKIRLLAPEQVTALTRRAEPPKAPAPAPAPAPAQAIACLEWGGFTDADAARARQALEPLGLGAKLTQRRQEDVSGYWVYIGPMASRQSAVQKAGELKRLGVEDYFIVSEDTKWRNAVSLGIFKTEDAAKARLAALRAKGVKSATVGARETQPGKNWFQLHEASPALAAKLGELKQAYPGSEVRECAVDEKKG
jgi:hypothetical protein